MGLNFGPGFADAYLKQDNIEKEQKIKSQELDLKAQDVASQVALRKEQSAELARKKIEDNRNQLIQMGSVYRDIFQDYWKKNNAPFPMDNDVYNQAMDHVATTYSYLKASGVEPQIAQSFANAMKTAMEAPPPQEKGVALGEESRLVNPITGETIIPAASGTAKPQSLEGKKIADRNLFVQQYGENSPQVKAFDEMVSTPGEATINNISGIRKEFTAQSKDFVTIRDAFGKIAVAAQNPSAAGDLSLIFGFMKMLDPGSTVREGEFATAQNSAGVPDRVINMYNKALNGERLNDNQRADFTNQAQNVFKVQLKNHLQTEEQYKKLAVRNKISPDDAVIDFVGPYRNAIGGSNEAPKDKADPLNLRK